MAIISTYAADASVGGNEKLLGSESKGSTVNISIDNIAEYYGNNNSIISFFLLEKTLNIFFLPLFSHNKK